MMFFKKKTAASKVQESSELPKETQNNIPRGLANYRQNHPDQNIDFTNLTSEKIGEVLGAMNNKSVTIGPADMSGCDFSGRAVALKFKDVKLSNADFKHSDFAGADFSGAINLHLANNLNLCVFPTKSGSSFAMIADRSIEKYELSSDYYPKDTWEQLRTYGNLPIFSASWITLALTPMYYYSINKINAYSASFQMYTTENGFQMEWPRIVPDWGILLLYFGAIILVFASTSYAILCPDEVKEYSRTKWTHELGNPLIHYLPLTWKYPLRRRVIKLLYTSGGFCTIIAVGWKTICAFILAIRIFVSL